MTAPTTVVCFDRDYTVSVSQYSDEGETVPLAWVKHLAHDVPEVDVWATGNQFLAREAAIPGMATADACWRRLHDGHPRDEFEHDDIRGQRDDHFHPIRRDCLRMIQQLYDALDANPSFAIVDDIDLSDMAEEGWTYHEPWTFHDAVADGEPPVPGLDDAIDHSETPANEMEEPPETHRPYPQTRNGMTVEGR